MRCHSGGSRDRQRSVRARARTTPRRGRHSPDAWAAGRFRGPRPGVVARSARGPGSGQRRAWSMAVVANSLALDPEEFEARAWSASCWSAEEWLARCMVRPRMVGPRLERRRVDGPRMVGPRLERRASGWPAHGRPALGATRLGRRRMVGQRRGAPGHGSTRWSAGRGAPGHGQHAHGPPARGAPGHGPHAHGRTTPGRHAHGRPGHGQTTPGRWIRSRFSSCQDEEIAGKEAPRGLLPRTVGQVVALVLILGGLSVRRARRVAGERLDDYSGRVADGYLNTDLWYAPWIVAGAFVVLAAGWGTGVRPDLAGQDVGGPDVPRSRPRGRGAHACPHCSPSRQS